MSHDIRTPINGICGMLDMADHYADDMKKQTEYRVKIKGASHLLLELVNEILDMSKLESDEVVLEESPFNLSSISREVLVVIGQIAAEQNIRIVWEKKRNHTPASYRKPGICETGDDEYSVECSEI